MLERADRERADVGTNPETGATELGWSAGEDPSRVAGRPVLGPQAGRPPGPLSAAGQGEHACSVCHHRFPEAGLKERHEREHHGLGARS